MSTNEEIHGAVTEANSRLGTIEGKVNLLVRAQRDGLLADLRKEVAKNPQIAQIYLLLDGERTQREILDELVKQGIATSQPTVSRRMADMATEHGIAYLVQGGATSIYRRDAEMEQTLNLARKMRDWLTADKQTVPVAAAKRARNKPR